MRIAPDNVNQRRPVTTMNAWERQQVFREMVLHQLRQGTLSRRRRKTIVQYAACLGINAVQAGRLIQEAQREWDREFESLHPRLRLAPAERVTAAPRRWRMIFGIALGASLLHTWIVMQLFA